MALLYVGSYTSQMSGQGVGITTFSRDDARLTKLADLATPAPSYLIADPDRPVLYAVNELDEGTVSSYAVGPDGTLRHLSSQPAAGQWPCHLAVHRGQLLAANYGSGSVSVHPVGRDGVLGARTDLVQHTGHGPNPDRQEGPHAHQVLIGADGEVTVVDLGIDRLSRYRLADGRLEPAGETATPPGSGPRHAVIHPNGRWYVAAELGSAVLTLERDPATGALVTAGQTASTSSPEGNQPSAVVLAADGRHLYLGNRGANTVATFAIGDDGTPTLVGEVDCGGNWPRDVALVDDLLFVANERSHAVVAFRLDTETGLPRPTGHVVETGSPTCVLPR